MTLTHFLVIGANRGIGLELTHQLLQNQEHIVAATYRDPSKLEDLNTLLNDRANNGRLVLVQLDMNDAGSCKSAAKEVRSKIGALDVVIVNAGINMKATPLVTQNLDEVANIFGTNVLGPLRICQAFVPLLEVQKNLRSPAYGISKAALNMAGRKLAAELQPSNIIVALVHPGWVKTDMGGPNAQITPTESAVGILQVIEQLSMDNSGEFWVYNGEKHPW
ncbi:short chain dehydrogenase [Ceratobasidium sp. AG-Ba]|nr:short chain dehydrogenase [Ceratobasidium sp. AG-Ba]